MKSQPKIILEGEVVLQDLSNRTTQRAPDGACRLDGKRRPNSIGFAQQLNNMPDPVYTRAQPGKLPGHAGPL